MPNYLRGIKKGVRGTLEKGNNRENKLINRPGHVFPA